MASQPAKLVKTSTKFSNRVRTHSRVAQYWPIPQDTNSCVFAVNDQLIVSRQLAPTTKQLQTLLAPVLSHNTASVLASMGDYNLVRLATPGGTPSKPFPKDIDIFDITTELRKPLKPSDRGAVSPNHIAVPARNGDTCPHGPPREYDGRVPPTLASAVKPSGSYRPPITLIDSGYIDWSSEWGPDPLAALLGAGEVTATMAQCVDDFGLGNYAPETIDSRNTPAQRIDDLAGHANFAAGILASRSNQPSISIWDHNGSFVDNELNTIPTEFAVAESLLDSQQTSPAQVIMITFAFPAFEGLSSGVWDVALAMLEHLSPGCVIVAPAGNQGTATIPCTGPHYPAALSRTHPQVIGVASLEPTTFSRSSFSNSGTSQDRWVTCAAIGEEVSSTFLGVNLPPEETRPPDVPAGNHDFKDHNSWALWQGTSFAAPKVAAAIANQLGGPAANGVAAWAAVKTDPDLTSIPATSELGIRFNGL